MSDIAAVLSEAFDTMLALRRSGMPCDEAERLAWEAIKPHVRIAPDDGSLFRCRACEDTGWEPVVRYSQVYRQQHACVRACTCELGRRMKENRERAEAARGPGHRKTGWVRAGATR